MNAYSSVQKFAAKTVKYLTLNAAQLDDLQKALKATI
jgi:hypothetical protein